MSSIEAEGQDDATGRLAAQQLMDILKTGNTKLVEQSLHFLRSTNRTAFDAIMARMEEKIGLSGFEDISDDLATTLGNVQKFGVKDVTQENSFLSRGIDASGIMRDRSVKGSGFDDRIEALERLAHLSSNDVSGMGEGIFDFVNDLIITAERRRWEDWGNPFMYGLPSQPSISMLLDLVDDSGTVNDSGFNALAADQSLTEQQKVQLKTTLIQAKQSKALVDAAKAEHDALKGKHHSKALVDAAKAEHDALKGKYHSDQITAKVLDDLHRKLDERKLTSDLLKPLSQRVTDASRNLKAKTPGSDGVTDQTNKDDAKFTAEELRALVEEAKKEEASKKAIEELAPAFANALGSSVNMIPTDQLQAAQTTRDIVNVLIDNVGPNDRDTLLKAIGALLGEQELESLGVVMERAFSPQSEAMGVVDQSTKSFTDDFRREQSEKFQMQMVEGFQESQDLSGELGNLLVEMKAMEDKVLIAAFENAESRQELMESLKATMGVGTPQSQAMVALIMKRVMEAHESEEQNLDRLNAKQQKLMEDFNEKVLEKNQDIETLEDEQRVTKEDQFIEALEKVETSKDKALFMKIKKGLQAKAFGFPEHTRKNNLDSNERAGRVAAIQVSAANSDELARDFVMSGSPEQMRSNMTAYALDFVDPYYGPQAEREQQKLNHMDNNLAKAATMVQLLRHVQTMMPELDAAQLDALRAGLDLVGTDLEKTLERVDKRIVELQSKYPDPSLLVGNGFDIAIEDISQKLTVKNQELKDSLPFEQKDINDDITNLNEVLDDLKVYQQLIQIKDHYSHAQSLITDTQLISDEYFHSEATGLGELSLDEHQQALINSLSSNKDVKIDATTTTIMGKLDGYKGFHSAVIQARVALKLEHEETSEILNELVDLERGEYIDNA